MILDAIFYLLAQMCAILPPNQCNQLKIGRLLDVGAGRNRAANGCKKQTIVVTVPRIACGLSSADQPPISMNIKTNAAIVNPHVRIMNIRCHYERNKNSIVYISETCIESHFMINLRQTIDPCRTIGCQPMFA